METPSRPGTSDSTSTTTSVTRNFSRPGSALGMSPVNLPKKQVAQADAEEEVLPSRPVRSKIVQYRVTSDDINISHRRKDSANGRPLPPVILERSDSKTSTKWPVRVQERKAGSINFEVTPTLTRTPWEKDRGKPKSRWSRVQDRKQNAPSRIFVQLPREIYQCVLDHMEGVHVRDNCVDVQALRNDLLSLCLVDKRWHRIAREHLYREVWLPSNTIPPKRRWSTKQPRSKLRILLDTVSRSPGMGFLIHRVRIPDAMAVELAREASAPFLEGSGLDALRELLLQCYNLEQLSGYVLPTTVSTVPVLAALAGRTRLRSYAWNLDSKTALPSLDEFIDTHVNWTHLETLVIAADPGVDLGPDTITSILPRLPSLRNLMISGIHQLDFNNETLLPLPALKSLRLENLVGLTDEGIEKLAFSRLALSLQRLTLVDLEVVSFQTVRNLLSHLTRLRRFALVQHSSPEPQTAAVTISKSKVLGSPSLTYLHWDCLVPGTALSLFSKAIEEGRFPRLGTVKVPSDYDGSIQRLCRPIPLQKLTQADLDYLDEHTRDRWERNLRVAQIQSQIRARESRQQPAVEVVVQDESLEVQKSHTIGSFLGDIGSKIEYNLWAETEWNGLAEFEDIVRLPKSASSRLERLVDISVLL